MYTIAEAQRCKFISRYIVSTDDDEIRKNAKLYGADAPFKRPRNISSDTATSTDALIHAVKWCEKDSGLKYDFIVELMCTNPLKTSNDIDKQ